MNIDVSEGKTLNYS